MARIFICYSRHNQQLVEDLSHDLEALGHSTWYDLELSGGQLWWDQILDQIRGCDVFVFALAPQSLESHACRLEYTYAAQLGKNLLPVLVADGVSLNLLPPVLSTIQHVDYRLQEKGTVINLIKAINQLPAAGPLPETLPEPPEVPISYLGELKEQIETERSLSFQDQAGLVFKLKQRLPDTEYPEETISLLLRLRERDDLLAKIASEIDTVVAEFRGGQRKATEEDHFAFEPDSAATVRVQTEPPEKPPEPSPKPVASATAGVAQWLVHKVTLLFLLCLHILLGGVVAALVSQIPRDLELAGGALAMFFIGGTVLLIIRRKLKKYISGGKAHSSQLQQVFASPAGSRAVRWVLNIGLFLFLVFPGLALINTLDRMGGF